MSREQLDMAVPISVNAANDYYRENMNNILHSISDSTINSAINERELELCDYYSSTTASDSEVEDQSETGRRKRSKIQSANKSQELKKSEQSTGSDNNVSLQNKLQNINTVEINNSSDVHFGNKTFFNGPVTIKQIVLSNENNNIDNNPNVSALGTLNQAFEGSLNNLSPKQGEESKKPEQINKTQTDSKPSLVEILRRSRIKILVIGIIILFLLSAISVTLYFKSNPQDDKIEIIPRKDWNAVQINGTLDDLQLPLKRVIICHTVTSNCSTKDECLKVVLDIQHLHLNPPFGFSDIGYNFLIGGDGIIYEGRGWYKQGAHTSGYNRGSLGIAYIGNFVSKPPNQKQIDAGFRLFKEGLRIGVLSNDYEIYGASQLRNTESPGDAFLQLIKNWPHAAKDS